MSVLPLGYRLSVGLISCLFSSRPLDREEWYSKSCTEVLKQRSLIHSGIRIRWQDPEIQVNATMGWNLGVFTVGLLVFYIWEIWNVAREWTMEDCAFQILPQYILYYMFLTQCSIDTVLIEYWSLFPIPWWTFGIASVVYGKRIAMRLLRLNHSTCGWSSQNGLLLKLAILQCLTKHPGRGPWRGNEAPNPSTWATFNTD